jgi:hypothetical protein
MVGAHLEVYKRCVGIALRHPLHKQWERVVLAVMAVIVIELVFYGVS